jgi:hypothetical protein
MADIILAEYRGQAWLVSGEQYIDDLLANTLPDHISIEFIACESHSDVNGLWKQNCGDPTGGGAPWVIHPAIANRIRHTQSGYSVFFGQWSALLDKDADAVIRASAIWAEECGAPVIEVTKYVVPDGPKAMADLADLRATLVESKLAEFGISLSRIVRASRDVSTVPGMGAESQRIDIVAKTT